MVQLQNAAALTSPWFRFFLYGDTGAGKTHALGTFPKPIFLVPSNENSMLTLRGRNIDYIEISDRRAMQEAIQWLLNKYNQAMRAPEEQFATIFPWETICVESLSHYCELLVDDISKRGSKKMDQQGWGQLSTHLRVVHSQLSALDVHVAYTSLGKLDDAGRGQPLMIGKNALMMPSACDVVAYCEAVPVARGAKPIYRVHFRQYGVWPARSRIQGLPDYVDNFTFADIAPLLEA